MSISLNEDAIIPGLIVLIPTFIFFFYLWNKYCREDKEKKRREEEHKAHRASLKKLCANNDALEHAVSQRNYYLDRYVRNSMYSIFINFEPTPPQYTRGVIKGSIADNISVLSNAQKKANYEQEMKEYREREQKKCTTSQRSFEV